MPKKKTKKFDDDVGYDIDSIFDEEEKASKLNSISVGTKLDPTTCLSSGILCFDLISGGGLKAGSWYEIVGPESGGKTTAMYEAFNQALLYIPNSIKGLLLDVEGVLDYQWFSNITGVSSLKKIFGERDDDKGEWIIKPKIRYYKPAFGEMGLKFIRKTLKRMPDKVLVKDTWYYVFVPKMSKAAKKEDPEGGIKKLREKLKGRYNKNLFTQTGNLYVPVPNNYAGVELLIGIDSLASMTPEAISEDDSGALGEQARMFGKYGNDIKSLISKKGATLFGLNQIREKPMQLFGDPEYSPGGNTIKHCTDCRARFSTVNVIGGKGPIEFEDDDEYRYCRVKTKKNKLFIPYQETYFRWWVGHKGTSGFGSDPVMDTYRYLEMTGQVAKEGKHFRIDMKRFSKIKFTWSIFKDNILGTSKKIKGNVRNFCIKQIMNGKGMDLYIKNISK